MALDFQQIRSQIKKLGESAPAIERRLRERRDEARQVLEGQAGELEPLRHKVDLVVRQYEPSLRCAVPVSDPLDACLPTPPALGQATIIAADGSQIYPDRHAEVNYCLINVGAISMSHGSTAPPGVHLSSRLLYDQGLSSNGELTVAMVALRRDLHEREMLANLAVQASPPVITFTDGPMELWGARDPTIASEFQKSLGEYVDVLNQLCAGGVITAGYVDKPGANLVVRLLEVAMLAESELSEINKKHPLNGVTDRVLYWEMLQPGERSAVFELQSQSASYYQGDLALHFFYLNTGRPGRPSLARVDLPAWVARNPVMLDDLHAALVGQCRIMGARPYPYLLHRAHEAAVVSLQEKDQVTQMIAGELRRRGVRVGERSNKQAAKDLSGKKRYER
ncbi:MAG TPA: DNA double-strand break repair nuclease NurA [Anaerolineales bacterium]|jgi:hypothetical protein|nr:DNA double-strand break repair nuclease NurA [Anaerolineales bacterium]